jgi:hypothetical protein
MDPTVVYSPLNNYTYREKPFLCSFLDWLSTPCRRILGGRNACILSLTHHNEMSTAGKVATIFFSVLIFPITGVTIGSFIVGVPIASLMIKLATFPWIWEKKKVEVQDKQTEELIIILLENAYKQQNSETFTQILDNQPELAKRDDVSEMEGNTS